MTVIVASRTGILSDSKCTAGNVSYRSTKIIRHKKELLGLAGNNTGLERFLRWYKGKRHKALEIDSDESFEVVVVNKRGIFVYLNCSLPDPVHDEYYFAGSGGSGAECAMKAGATVREAIEIVCDVIESCGLPIQEETL